MLAQKQNDLKAISLNMLDAWNQYLDSEVFERVSLKLVKRFLEEDEKLIDMYGKEIQTVEDILKETYYGYNVFSHNPYEDCREKIKDTYNSILISFIYDKQDEFFNNFLNAKKIPKEDKTIVINFIRDLSGDFDVLEQKKIDGFINKIKDEYIC